MVITEENVALRNWHNDERNDEHHD